jgi:hypothetical protein
MSHSKLHRWLTDELSFPQETCVICGKTDDHYNMDHEYTSDYGALWDNHLCRNCSIYRALFFINRIGIDKITSPVL